MEVPSWRHRGINNRYRKSVTELVVTAVSKAVVSGCVAAVTVLREVDDMEEEEGEADKFR